MPRRLVLGTVVYAVCIGPLAHIFVPLFSRPAQQKTLPDRGGRS